MTEIAINNYDQRLNNRDVAWGRALLFDSGIFDQLGYVVRAGEETRADPIGHYLDTGWRFGLEPNDSFPGTFLLPYFAAIGAYGPPAITWLILRSAGWPMYTSRGEIEYRAHRIRHSGLFSDSYYSRHLPPGAQDLDPAVHYVSVGERMGLAPSTDFDPRYYLDRNPDVAATGINCLLHFIDRGRAEGRMPKPADALRLGRAKFDPSRENLILVVHDASRTGAPILGWNMARFFARSYNIFTVRLGEGELESHYLDISVEVYGPFLEDRRNPVDLEHSLTSFLRERKYAFAIVNSSESRLAVEPLIRHFVPTLFLLHEFASCISPVFSFISALDWSTEVVFSAPMVANATEEVHPNLAAREIHILPQGVTELPPGKIDNPNEESASKTLARLAAEREKDGTFIVLGVGFVQVRKGVDLFLSAAAAIARRHPQRSIHFLWVGDGYRPKDDLDYSVYLKEQLDRSGLSEHVTFLGVVSNVEPAYRIADAYFLSSRLDPLPNSAIDAAVAGIPVVCFRDASGIADLLLAESDTAVAVVDHLDSDAAAQVIFDLATNPELYARVSRSTRELARHAFDLEAYCKKLEALGRDASVHMKQRAADLATLAEHPAFDQDMFLGTAKTVETRENTIHRYLALWSARGWTQLIKHDPYLRRPCPGFNPRIYAAAYRDRLKGSVDPLADFVRRGEPSGPWMTTVLRPDDMLDGSPPSRKLHIAIHAHIFYPELCADFLLHLAPNQTPCDLLISTNDSAKAERIRQQLHGYARGSVTIRVVPNRGRDLAPLLTEFATELDRYDVIGHIHSKRSKWVDGMPADIKWGDRWREFLWQNLLGGLHPMMDRIVAAFEHHDSLGLVFPSDPHLGRWDDNRECAAHLAPQMGWTDALPEHFDFPLGNMFWVRRAALQPFLNLRLTWDQYPAEPLPYDGTLLHALERLTPLACRAAGFCHAVTHVPGVTWSPAEL